jgi:hypothetical protein
MPMPDLKSADFSSRAIQASPSNNNALYYQSVIAGLSVSIVGSRSRLDIRKVMPPLATGFPPYSASRDHVHPSRANLS